MWATGHHRNGILLAPLTAELVTSALTGDAPRRLDSAFAACDPARFTAPASDAASRAEGAARAIRVRA